jgi:hypothetical protein
MDEQLSPAEIQQVVQERVPAFTVEHIRDRLWRLHDHHTGREWQTRFARSHQVDPDALTFAVVGDLAVLSRGGMLIRGGHGSRTTLAPGSAGCFIEAIATLRSPHDLSPAFFDQWECVPERMERVLEEIMTEERRQQ